MMHEPDIRAMHDLTLEEIDALGDRLYEFNAKRTGYRDFSPLAFVVEDVGELIGAVEGFTWGGICEVRQLWIHEAHRGRGLGANLMRRVIQEARDRRCASIFLNTYDFQASGFYAKLGFERVAEIHGKPLGHSDIVMRLSLSDAC